MSSNDARFVGSIPENYDRYLGPMLFEPYAADLVERLKVPAGGRVLEIACGTGIVTRRLRAHLRPDIALTATDLNAPMVEYARQAFDHGAAVEWRTADALALPFSAGEFNAVVCQFGLMFVPDKPAALREARRVLRPGGILAFNVWARLADNPLGRIANAVITNFFPVDPPTFYQIPYGLDDQPLLRQLLSDAGFRIEQEERVTLTAQSPAAEDAARGLVVGNPVLLAIQERGTMPPERIVAALATELAREGGTRPLRLPMSALVFVARAV